MFRLSDNLVVDATMAGGPARYINHSCHPNCVAEVVPLEKDSKIIIITKRKIAQGEEVFITSLCVWMFDYQSSVFCNMNYLQNTAQEMLLHYAVLFLIEIFFYCKNCHNVSCTFLANFLQISDKSKMLLT